MDVAAVRAGDPRCHVFGRGAADMKTGIGGDGGRDRPLLAETPDARTARLGLLITSDEEGDAVDGTVKVVD